MRVPLTQLTEGMLLDDPAPAWYGLELCFGDEGVEGYFAFLFSLIVVVGCGSL